MANRLDKLQQRVQELEDRLDRMEAAKARDFEDTDKIVRRNLYAERVYTKTNGTFQELQP